MQKCLFQRSLFSYLFAIYLHTFQVQTFVWSRIANKPCTVSSIFFYMTNGTCIQNVLFSMKVYHSWKASLLVFISVFFADSFPFFAWLRLDSAMFTFDNSIKWVMSFHIFLLILMRLRIWFRNSDTSNNDMNFIKNSSPINQCRWIIVIPNSKQFSKSCIYKSNNSGVTQPLQPENTWFAYQVMYDFELFVKVNRSSPFKAIIIDTTQFLESNSSQISFTIRNWQKRNNSFMADRFNIQCSRIFIQWLQFLFWHCYVQCSITSN